IGAIAALWLASWAFRRLLFSIKIARLAKTVPGVDGGIPILGQAINLVTTPPWDLLTSWVSRYGPLYRFNMFGTQVVVLADPHYIREIMNTKLSYFHKDLVFAYKPFMPLFGDGIVTSDGPKWFHQRRQL
ncbi:cytochrome P450, partial [Tribonema minus]